MTESRTVGDRLRAMLEADEGSASSHPHVAPVAICVFCRQAVTADEGTHRLIGSRWFAVHRGPCPERVP
jgi:hypothetical protein